jgi:hypothetical protein
LYLSANDNSFVDIYVLNLEDTYSPTFIINGELDVYQRGVGLFDLVVFLGMITGVIFCFSLLCRVIQFCLNRCSSDGDPRRVSH